VIVVAAAVVVVVSVVGRTGAFGVFVDESAGQTAPDPHALSVGQHPPPSEAGHDLKLGEHVSTLLGKMTAVEVVVTFELVGTMIGELVDSGVGIGMIILVDVTVFGEADGSVGVTTVVNVIVVVEALKVDEGVGVITVVNVIVVVEALKADEGVGVTKTVAVPV
jgi:hypothetical protein